MKVMNQKQITIVVLVTLLVVGVTGVSTSSPGKSRENTRLPAVLQKPPTNAPSTTNSLQELASQDPDWQPVNSSGFGVQANVDVSALGVFNGYLYAGTSNPTDGAQIFRSQDGVTWTAVTQPGFGIPHDTRPLSILDLTIFNGRLYASTGRGEDPGQIWRSLDGINWAPVVIHGFSDPDTVDITCLAEYNGMLYAGATNRISGVLIFRSFTGDSNTWTLHTPLAPGTNPARVTGLAVIDGGLYAAVDSLEPAQIWSTYGGAWAPAVSDGFGNSLTTSTGGMAEFASYLYVGAGNEIEGAQLWRTQDGTNWEQTIDPGFGDPNNQAVEVVFVFQNQLYIGVMNAQSGLEVWRSPDGTNWEQINQDGFGDPNNTVSNGSNAVAEYLGNLYLGTANLVDGGEIWRMQGTAQPTPVPTQPPQPLQNYIFIPLTLRLP